MLNKHYRVLSCFAFELSLVSMFLSILWHNPENRFEFERECQRLLRAQILNGPIRVKDETALQAAIVVDPIVSEENRRGEF